MFRSLLLVQLLDLGLEDQKARCCLAQAGVLAAITASFALFGGLTRLQGTERTHQSTKF